MPKDTKTMIAETFASMAAQKGIDKITVKALIEACGISRQTFYYHFQDIMDVIEWTIERKSHELLVRSLKEDEPEKAFELLLSGAVENRAIAQKLLESQRREYLERLFVQAVRTYLLQMIQARFGKDSMRYSDLEVALDLWSFGIAGLMFQCIYQDNVDIENLSRQIYRTLSGKFRETD